MTAQSPSLIGTYPTIEDLETERIHAIREPQLCWLLGKSRSWAQKRRYLNLPPEYERDDCGRITYLASTVLAYLRSRQRCKSTCEYDTSSNQRNLEKARRTATSQKACTSEQLNCSQK